MLRDGMISAPTRSADVRPRVLVPACNRMLGGLCYHVAASKYFAAVPQAGCHPLIVPRLPAPDAKPLPPVPHGLLSPAWPPTENRSHYAENVLDESLPLDPARDAWILPLI